MRQRHRQEVSAGKYFAHEIRGKELQMFTAHFEVIIALIVNSSDNIVSSGFHDEGFRFPCNVLLIKESI